MIRANRFHPDHIRILKGAAWVVLFVLLGKLAGASKEMAIAYRYGVSGTVDAYQVAFTTVTWLPTTLVSVLGVVLVPLLVRARFAAEKDESVFVHEVQSAGIILGLLLVLVTVLASTFYVNHIASNLPEETRVLAIQLTRWLSPVAALTLIIGVLSARLQSHGKQLNTLLECIPALAILVFLLSPALSMDASALLWGTLVGFGLQSVFLSMAAKNVDGIAWQGTWHWRSNYWPEIFKAVGIMALGQFVMSFVTPLDQYFAAQLGEGSIATLGYANRLLALGMSVGAMAIARSAMPVLADAIAQGNHEHARLVAMKWAGAMLLVGMVLVALGWLLAPLTVRLMFERGAFTSEDTQSVANCLRWGLFQLPFYFSVLVLVQLMASLKQYGFMALSAGSNFFVKTVVASVLVPNFGLAGLMVSTVAMYCFSFLCYWVFTFKTSAKSW